MRQAEARAGADGDGKARTAQPSTLQGFEHWILLQFDWLFDLGRGFYWVKVTKAAAPMRREGQAGAVRLPSWGLNRSYRQQKLRKESELKAITTLPIETPEFNGHLALLGHN